MAFMPNDFINAIHSVSVPAPLNTFLPLDSISVIQLTSAPFIKTAAGGGGTGGQAAGHCPFYNCLNRAGAIEKKDKILFLYTYHSVFAVNKYITKKPHYLIL